MNRATELATEILAFEEGFDSTPYVDTEGYVTVGYGLKISGKDQLITDFMMFPNMPERVARCWMETIVEDLYLRMMDNEVSREALRPCNWEQKAILISMAYQLGLRGLLKFRNTLQLIQEESFGFASIEMLDSRWARQTANRAERHAQVMKTGELVDEYRG